MIYSRVKTFLEISLDFRLAPEIMFGIAFEQGSIVCHKMRVEPMDDPSLQNRRKPILARSARG